MGQFFSFGKVLGEPALEPPGSCLPIPILCSGLDLLQTVLDREGFGLFDGVHQRFGEIRAIFLPPVERHARDACASCGHLARHALSDTFTDPLNQLPAVLGSVRHISPFFPEVTFVTVVTVVGNGG